MKILKRKQMNEIEVGHLNYGLYCGIFIGIGSMMVFYNNLFLGAGLALMIGVVLATLKKRKVINKMKGGKK